MPSNQKEKHKFVKFMSLAGEVALGFTCIHNGTQAMPDRDTQQRVIRVQCQCCGEHIVFDTGWRGWRLWFLPRRAFAAPQRRRLLTLSGGWDGNVTYESSKEL